MRLVKFPGHNALMAEHQHEYETMPVYRQPEYSKNPSGELTCCWQLTWRERLRLLWSGKIWHSVYTFWDPLQPQLLQVDRPASIPNDA